MNKKIFSVILLTALLAVGCNSKSATTGTTNNANPSTSSADSKSTQQYSMADVKGANTAQKCWTAINGNVYNLTPFLNMHAGGKANIMKLCGIDGTAEFMAQHKGQKKPESELTSLQIGVLK